MRTLCRVLGVVVLTAIMSAAIAAVWAADEPASPAAAASPAAPAKPSDEEVRKHLDAGEVWFGDKWAAIVALFKSYQSAEAEIAAVQEKDKASRERIAEIQKLLAKNYTDWQQKKQAQETEAAKIQAKGEAAQRTLNEPAPDRPHDYNRDAPSRSDYGRDSAYRDALHNWQRNRARLAREYQDRLDAYERRMVQYKEDQAKTKAALQQALGDYKDCENRIDALLAARKKVDQPLMTERQKIQDEISARGRNVGTLIARRQAIAAVFHEIPESVLAVRGIVEWRNEFYAVADLQTLCKKMEADVAEMIQAREKAKAVEAGRELPTDWRPPLQNDLDELKALLRKMSLMVKAG